MSQPQLIPGFKVMQLCTILKARSRESPSYFIDKSIADGIHVLCSTSVTSGRKERIVFSSWEPMSSMGKRNILERSRGTVKIGSWSPIKVFRNWEMIGVTWRSVFSRHRFKQRGHFLPSYRYCQPAGLAGFLLLFLGGRKGVVLILTGYMHNSEYISVWHYRSMNRKTIGLVVVGKGSVYLGYLTQAAYSLGVWLATLFWRRNNHS